MRRTFISFLIAILFSVFLWLTPLHAARLFTTGFEENDATATSMWNTWTSATNVTSATTAPHSGTYSLKVTTGQTIQRNLTTALTSGDVLLRIYWKTAELTSDNEFVRINNGGGTGLYRITKLNSGAIRLTNSITATNHDTTLTVSTNTWYRLELQVVISDTGSLVLNIYAGDSTSPLETVSPGTQDTLSTNVQGFIFKEATAGARTMYFDDIAINSCAVSGSCSGFQESFPGPGKIYLLTPNTEVSASFTPLSGTDNSLMVDDVPGTPDDDTSYNTHATANGEDRLGLTALGAEVTSDAVITLADVYGRVRGTGTTATRQMRFLLWDESSSQTNGPTTTLNDSTAYAVIGTNDHLVFNASGKTKTNFDSFDVGYEPLTSHDTLVTATWVNVEWIEAPAGSEAGFFNRRRIQ